MWALAAFAAVTAATAIYQGVSGASEARKARRARESEIERQKQERYELAREYLARNDYKKYALDPTKMKKEYGEAVGRGLQQQAGGTVAALSSQRSSNPALLSSVLSSQTAERQAQAAGQGALQEASIDYEADRYNKELERNIQDKAMNIKLGASTAANEQSLNSLIADQNAQSANRQQVLNIIGQGAGLGMMYAMGGMGNRGTNSSMSIAPSGYDQYDPNAAPSRLSLSGQGRGQMAPPLGFSPSFTPYDPMRMGGY